MLRKQDLPEENNTRHIFSEITVALFFFMILFVFVQQIQIIEVFERMKVSNLQNYISESIEESFKDKGFEDRIPEIVVDKSSPLIQKIIMSQNVLRFESGDILLRQEEDRKILELVGNILKENEAVFEDIKIEGHADTTALSISIQQRFPTNWEISTGRATTVVRYLTDEVGFPPAKISAVGFSSYHPIDQDSLSLNRRIELVIQFTYAKDVMYSDRARQIYDELKGITKEEQEPVSSLK